jgi:multidrug efflux pump subunit AcrA (membrane-fusion protein)
MAQPGQGILLLEDKSAGYNVRIQVPAEVQSDLEPGRKLTLFRGNDTLQTEISRIYPASVSPSPLIPVEAHLKHPPFGLPGGASIETRLGQGQMQGLIVPSRAVLEQEEGAFVFRVDEDSRIRAVPVTIRGRNRDRVLVRGEIRENDQVVVGPRSLLVRLSPGILVRKAAKGDS